MIEVANLSKRYGDLAAIRDVSFTAADGQILGFLGPNGAGKTTTMRIITGFMPATSGTVRVDGFDVFEQSTEVRRRIGYLPENPPLYNDMSVAGFLRFAERLKGVARGDIATALERVLETCGLTGVRDRLLGHLSKGFRQRVGLAQALIHNPDVLILDEPTAGLDPKQINETRMLIKELAGDHTIILSTHILPEVSQTCQRVVIINKGKVVAVDTPGNLTDRLSGSSTMYIQVDANGGDASGALSRIAGVARVIESDRRDGVVGYEVVSESGRDVRRDLANTVVTSGWGLVELRPARISLEEVFLTLTEVDEQPAPQAEGEQPNA